VKKKILKSLVYLLVTPMVAAEGMLVGLGIVKPEEWEDLLEEAFPDEQ